MRNTTELHNQEPMSLDEYLASRFSNVQDKKLEIYEAIIASLLRKYVKQNNKVELNLLKASNDTILDVTLNDNGIVKLSWGEDASI